ncbi:MAG: dihydroneopterin aldolase [Ectothiorhodospiraceae bacterium]
MDTVFIQDLRATAVIGVEPWERRVRQALVLDLELGAAVAAAAASDDVADALDYDAVSRFAAAWVERSAFQLVETLADGLAAALRQEFGVPWLRLRVTKPGAVAGTRGVGVQLERGDPTGSD